MTTIFLATVTDLANFGREIASGTFSTMDAANAAVAECLADLKRKDDAAGETVQNYSSVIAEYSLDSGME